MTPSLWVNGGFYLVAFAVIIALLAAVARTIPVWLLPIILIGGLVAVSVIGALELRRSDKLSQSNFLQLMALTFRQLPLLRRFWQKDGASN